jgi:hypothetical protein
MEENAHAFVADQTTLDDSAKNLSIGNQEKIIRPVTVMTSVKNFSHRFDPSTEIETDAVSGAVRLVTGSLAMPSEQKTKRSLVEVAMNWANTHRDILLTDPKNLELVEDAVLIQDDIQFLRFNVKHNGILIADAVVNFRFKQGALVQVQSRSFGEALTDLRSNRVTSRDAIKKLEPSAVVQELGEAFRVSQIGGLYRLVKVNRALVNLNERTLIVETDAHSGSVFDSRDTRFFAEGRARGRVYQRSYFKSQPIDANLFKLTIAAGSSTFSTGMDGGFVYQGTTTPRITSVRGPHARVRPITGSFVTRIASRIDNLWDLNLNVTTPRDIAQINTFYHLNLMIQKAKQYISASWMDRPLSVNVNLNDVCNAFWDGSSVNFFNAGQGCGNTALIADVIYHEWGHGLDANTGGISDGAYSEGFGDIMSLIMTNDPRLGIGFTTTGGIVRNLEPNRIYPKDRGSRHDEGLIIGGTFFDLLKYLTVKYDAVRANDIVSSIALKTVFTAVNYTDVYNAALIVNDDDSNPATQSPDFCEINAAFSEHGLAVKSSECP